MKKNTVTINLMILGIITLVIGVLYIFIGIYLTNVYDTYYYLENWGLVITIEGAIFELISFGLFTKYILPNRKGAFFYGMVLGIIGVIIAICVKNKKDAYKGNKYEDLEKLQKLKEQEIITNAEFETEKSKILK